MLPAAGQGILAVQCRQETRELLSCLSDREAALCAQAERAFVGALGGGCSSPTAAYAVIQGETLTLTGMYIDGVQRMHRGSVSGSAPEGISLAGALAERLKEGGK